ncbi:MAG: ABC transporter ATP-binding protein [Thermoproteota archaeon]|nr:ABC transporter ATP-binding protein [Candidatus Brockarchaeota archaeon]MBO3840406.1 ABC transporter ATP-binding protein [Candidatus Brockarchaeota archaeon]
MSEILQVKNLKLYYSTKKGVVKAVDNISFALNKGETLAVVGESGCGKSSMAIALMRLLPRNVNTYQGSIIVDNEDISKLDEKTLRERILWRKISMVFQGAMNSLNPVLKIGFQIAEALLEHDKRLSKKEALAIAKKSLELVRLPEFIADRYPHELSGGMKQRVVIAMALVLNPQIVILDEPTSALDVITQANIINLLKRLKNEKGLSYIFITHDLAVASELADRVVVMYGGKIVEYGNAEQIYATPKHPYTQKLIASIPTLRSDKTLEFIPGAPPDLIDPPPGCRFHPRCPYAMDICRVEEPPLLTASNGKVACWLYKGDIVE